MANLKSAPSAPERNKGTFNFAANFEILNKAPLDSRQVVNTFAGLLLAATWQDTDSNIWLFNGLIVAVVADTTPALNGVYYLKDAVNYTVPESWVKVGSASGGTSGITYTFVQSGATIITQSGGTVTFFTPLAPTDLSGFTDTTNLLFNKAYSGLTGTPDLSIYQTISGGTSGGTSIASWSGLTGNPTDSTGLTTLLTNYLDNVTYNFNNNILSQELTDIENGLIYLSGHTSSGGTGGGNEVYTGATPAAITVGGVNAGDDLTSLTFNQLFERILVPTLFPTLTQPSLALYSDIPQLCEMGQVVTINFSAYFNQGYISPAYNTSGILSGLPISYNYTGGGLPTTPVFNTGLTDTQVVSGYTVLQGNQLWSCFVHYSSGDTVINDSKGHYFADALPEGDMYIVGSNSTEGVYPLFGTTSSIITQTKQDLVSMIYGNDIVLNMVAESGGNKQSFEIADTWHTNRPLVGIMTFNTVSNNYEYQGGSATASLTHWTITSVTETIQGHTINYDKYTYNGTDRASIQIMLVF
jgi:hypothetical protein